MVAVIVAVIGSSRRRRKSSSWPSGGDDVHANAASVLCFSCCFVFCALVGRGGMGAFRTGFLRCFPKICGQHCADPRLVAHARLDFHVYVFDLRAGVGRGGG